MTHYTDIKMRISEGQKEKINKAIESNNKFITNRFGYTDLFTRMKEDLRIKSKTSLEKTVNIETEDSVLFNRNSSTSPT